MALVRPQAVSSIDAYCTKNNNIRNLRDLLHKVLSRMCHNFLSCLAYSNSYSRNSAVEAIRTMPTEFSLLTSSWSFRTVSRKFWREKKTLVPSVPLHFFRSYGNVWQQFEKDSQADWNCDDCPGTPSYVFLSATNDVAPQNLGVSCISVDLWAFPERVLISRWPTPSAKQRISPCRPLWKP